MALRGKARSITIDDRTYKWIVSDANYPSLEIWIQAEHGDGQKLHVPLPHGGRPTPEEGAITPRLIEWLIRRAFSRGWRPNERGPDFRLDRDYWYGETD